MQPIATLHHVLVWVVDMERALKFYTQTIGLEADFESSDFSVVGGGLFKLSLHRTDAQNNIGKSTTTPIVVLKPKDVDRAYLQLQSAGVEFYQAPYWAAPDIRVAEFYDSEGNRLSLSSAE